MTDTATLRALVAEPHNWNDDAAFAAMQQIVNALPALLDKADALAALVAAGEGIILGEPVASVPSDEQWKAFEDALAAARRLVEGS